MGVENYLLADTLRGIIAQRLIRRICISCKTKEEVNPEALHRLGIGDDGAVFYRGAGCDSCRGTGYKGRVAVYEILHLTPELRLLIQQGKSTAFLHKAACGEGMITLRENAIEKAKAGITTISEILRIID